MFAVAVEAGVEGTGSAAAGQFAAESSASSMGSDGGVAGGQVVALGVVGEWGFGEVYFAQDFGVSGPKRG